MDELFDLPPSAFTAARDALAKRLKAEGDKEGAAAVKALRRPTVAAWAVNQVARTHPELVDAVVAAGQKLAGAQSSVLAGGDKQAMRSAMAARRDAVGAAVKAAVALAGEQHRDDISATFDAAATSEEAAEAVRAGRLTRELDAPSGFGGDLAAVFAVSDGAAGPAPEPEPDPELEKRRRAAEAAAARAEKKADAAELRRAALERELAEATEVADAAAEEARRLREEADALG